MALEQLTAAHTPQSGDANLVTGASYVSIETYYPVRFGDYLQNLKLQCQNEHYKSA